MIVNRSNGETGAAQRAWIRPISRGSGATDRRNPVSRFM